MRRALSGLDGLFRRTMPGSCLNSQHRTRRRKRSTSLCFLRHSSSMYCECVKMIRQLIATF
jgi:uncharacterized protein (UPF0303 family)